MDFWSKARSFAQEAANRSQELTMEVAKRSQEITLIGGTRLTEIVSEASKKSMELASEASKHADLIKIEALKRADQIKSLSIADSSSSSPSPSSSAPEPSAEELETFGVTEELREFVKEITLHTFKEFPLPDDAPLSDVPTVSNVRQDLNEWQAKHANIVLSTVKEISKLRYELCPRFMRDRKFWRIYFMIVNNHTAPYEQRYMEQLKLKQEQEKEKEDEAKEASKSEAVSRSDTTGTSQKSKNSADQDLDVFLLGDLGDDDVDDGPDDGDDDEGFDDDFDKIDGSSEDEQPKNSEK